MSQDTNRTTRRHLNNRIRRRNFWIIALAILALLLLGHVIWCLNHHLEDSVCSVCKAPETGCRCKSAIGTLYDRIAALEENNAQLQEENDQLVNTLMLYESQQIPDDGRCHANCPVHCPDCFHINTSVVTETHKTVKGTKDICCIETTITKTVCDDCGQVIDSNSKSRPDKEHNYGKDRVCDDCGYTKPSDEYKPVWTPTAEPTAKPTAKPTAEPTAKPTVEPTVVPTVVPTAEPTAEPTVVPTVEPTKCPHKEYTEVGREPISPWKKVSSSAVCCERTILITYKCNACGVTFTKEEPELDYEHNFEGRGCKDCDYVRPRQEGFGEAGGSIPPVTNGWVEEDNSQEAMPVG